METVQVTLRLPADVHRQFRMKTISEGTSVQAVLLGAVEAFVKLSPGDVAPVTELQGYVKPVPAPRAKNSECQHPKGSLRKMSWGTLCGDCGQRLR